MYKARVILTTTKMEKSILFAAVFGNSSGEKNCEKGPAAKTRSPGSSG
jgi:hypothetical protein